jgi:hypothetical protein
LIFVALSVLMLTAFSAFVLDYGVMWMSRRQAQNAADAGALAGAIARAFDEPSAPGPVTTAAATQAAQLNLIMGEPGGVVVNTGPCPAWSTGGECVRVDVYRDSTNGSTALPVYFATLFGVTSQQVRATATARVAGANTSNCLKPWIVPDIWLEEGVLRSTFPDTYDAWIPVTGETMGPNPDSNDLYIAPDAESGDPGTGFQTDLDVGRVVTLKAGSFDTISDSVFFRWDVPREDGIEDGSDNEQYRANISGECSGIDIGIGDIINDPDCSGYSCLRTLDGSADGPTWQETRRVVDADPGAYWDETSDSVQGSAYATSPRVIHMPVFDIDHFASQWRQHGSQFTLRIVNIVSFFIESYTQDPSTVTGRFMHSGGTTTTGSTVPLESSFLKTIHLIQ